MEKNNLEGGTFATYITSEAREYGLIEAILLNNIRFFSDYHSRKGDGDYFYSKVELADNLGISERRVYRACKNLEDLGLISWKSGYKPGTLIKTTFWKIHENLDAELSETTETVESEKTIDKKLPKRHNPETTETVESINNKQYNKQYNKDKSLLGENAEKNSEIVEMKENKEIVKNTNENVDYIFEKWQEITGSPISSRFQANRRAGYNLTRKYDKNTLEALLRAVRATYDDPFAPRISSLEDLQRKMNELLAWIKRYESARAKEEEKTIIKEF